jgi:hypothetical protein
MHQDGAKKEPDPAIRRLYPDLGPKELLIAEERLDEYLRFTMRMYEQIASDPQSYREFKTLTKRKFGSTIDRERSNPNERTTPT